jgi:hypothetical protein
VGPRKISDALASPLGQAVLAARGALASWPASDETGQGRREQGEDDGTDVQKTKIAGAWVKKRLKLNLPKVKSKTFEYHFYSTFEGKHFIFCDYVHLSNA